MVIKGDTRSLDNGSYGEARNTEGLCKACTGDTTVSEFLRF